MQQLARESDKRATKQHLESDLFQLSKGISSHPAKTLPGRSPLKVEQPRAQIGAKSANTFGEGKGAGAGAGAML